MFTINIWTVIVAALANFIIGFLAHGPVAGKLWMKLSNIVPTGNEKFSDMYGQMAWNFVANLVAAYVLSVVIYNTSLPAVTCAVLLWLVIVTSSVMEVIWLKRKVSLWFFEIITSLVSFVVMALVLSWM